MINQIIRYTLFIIVVILLQILIVNNIKLNGYEYYLGAMPYVSCILFLPFELNSINRLFIAFFLGLIIDSFTNTMGVHTSALEMIAFLSPFLLKRLYGIEIPTNLFNQSFNGKLLTYSIISIIIHHFIVLSIESYYLSEILNVLFRSITISLSTLIYIFIIHTLIYRSIVYGAQKS